MRTGWGTLHSAFCARSLNFYYLIFYSWVFRFPFDWRYLSKTVSSYFPTQVTDVFTQGRDFATAVLPITGSSPISVITTIQRSLKYVSLSFFRFESILFIKLFIFTGFWWQHKMDFSMCMMCLRSRVAIVNWLSNIIYAMSILNQLKYKVRSPFRNDTGVRYRNWSFIKTKCFWF